MNIASEIAEVRSEGTVTYEWAEECTLTDQQKADIESSQIISKWAHQIPTFLDVCATLRADNPGMTDATVRSIAKGGFQTGS